jgi:hypothetical protein
MREAAGGMADTRVGRIIRSITRNRDKNTVRRRAAEPVGRQGRNIRRTGHSTLIVPVAVAASLRSNRSAV